MSFGGLVQYDSSDNSDEESDNGNITDTVNNLCISNNNKINNSIKSELNIITAIHQKKKLHLPDPIQQSDRLEIINAESIHNTSNNLLFNALPKPKHINCHDEIVEEDDDIPLLKSTQFVVEKQPKKEKGPVIISIPSLSDFDDTDETTNKKKVKQQSCKKLPGVLALLPPPKDEITTKAIIKHFIPHVLKKVTGKNVSPITTQINNNSNTNFNPKINTNIKPIKSLSALNSLNYDSNTDDEDEENCKSIKDKNIDFFSLSEPVNCPLSDEILAANMLPLPENKIEEVEPIVNSMEINENCDDGPSTKLKNTVMDLSKDEILLKNKTEIGPKLPVPEQEFNVDAEGNVAFDDKAIEYLCGKRGVKRKNQIINENDIIDINGEDIKPDERDWLVKALTEEPVRRPVSLGSGPSSQSKKKHQITYLAHQAKAMEIELQNQWASSNLARKQTRSKYGF